MRLDRAALTRDSRVSSTPFFFFLDEAAILARTFTSDSRFTLFHCLRSALKNIATNINPKVFRSSALCVLIFIKVFTVVADTSPVLMDFVPHPATLADSSREEPCVLSPGIEPLMEFTRRQVARWLLTKQEMIKKGGELVIDTQKSCFTRKGIQIEC